MSNRVSVIVVKYDLDYDWKYHKYLFCILPSSSSRMENKWHAWDFRWNSKNFHLSKCYIYRCLSNCTAKVFLKNYTINWHVGIILFVILALIIKFFWIFFFFFHFSLSLMYVCAPVFWLNVRKKLNNIKFESYLVSIYVPVCIFDEYYSLYLVFYTINYTTQLFL